MPDNARLTNTARLADRYLTDRNWAIAEKLDDFAVARGHTILELAFSWLLARAPVSSVIAGATRPEQIRANVAAGAWQLTKAEMAEVDGITTLTFPFTAKLSGMSRALWPQRRAGRDRGFNRTGRPRPACNRIGNHPGAGRAAADRQAPSPKRPGEGPCNGIRACRNN